MPSIQNATQTITDFPNKFVSPFGNDGVLPLYSSVPLSSPASGCLECVVCGDSILRGEIIANAAFNNGRSISGARRGSGNGSEESGDGPGGFGGGSGVDRVVITTMPTPLLCVINVFGSASTLGTFESFRMEANGVPIWSFGASYPNWIGNTPGVPPFPIPPDYITLPIGTTKVDFFLRENANGFPVDPGPIYPPFTTKTFGSGWYYDVTFSDGQRFVDGNTIGFKYSPPFGNTYWTPQGKVGVETLVFSWTPYTP
jgi:hypothetical protein